MTLQDGLRCALGKEIEEAKIVLEVNDATRHFTAYLTVSGDLVFGFDCTKGKPFPPSLDWWKNLFAWPKAYSIGSAKYKAMSGFLEEYKSLRDQMFKCIEVYQPRFIQIFGFSQGGAHATLAMRDIGYRNPEINLVTVAFASPRVYTCDSAGEFEEFLEGRKGTASFLRVNVNGDPVPSLPPVILGYKHVGPKVDFEPVNPVPDVVHNGRYYLEVLEGI